MNVQTRVISVPANALFEEYQIETCYPSCLEMTTNTNLEPFLDVKQSAHLDHLIKTAHKFRPK